MKRRPIRPAIVAVPAMLLCGALASAQYPTGTQYPGGQYPPNQYPTGGQYPNGGQYPPGTYPSTYPDNRFPAASRCRTSTCRGGRTKGKRARK